MREAGVYMDGEKKAVPVCAGCVYEAMRRNFYGIGFGAGLQLCWFVVDVYKRQQFGDENDALALEQLASIFPDKEVVGVDTLEIVYGGGNEMCIRDRSYSTQFQSTLPVRRATPTTLSGVPVKSSFQSTLPVRGATANLHKINAEILAECLIILRKTEKRGQKACIGWTTKAKMCIRDSRCAALWRWAAAPRTPCGCRLWQT